MKHNINSETVQVAQHDGWACIRIVREHKRNALDRATRQALMAAFEQLRGKARAIVLTGSGAAFCAGLDLKERAAERPEAGLDDAGAEWVALNLAIRAHPAAFIAAVNGVTLGGGLTLVNFCDLALASAEASFGCPELAFATYASASGPTTQLSAIARKRVAWLLLSGERLDAATLQEWGLLNEVLVPDALLPRAAELAQRIAAYDPHALSLVKKTLDHVPTLAGDWGQAMEYGRSVNEDIRRLRAQPATHTQETNP